MSAIAFKPVYTEDKRDAENALQKPVWTSVFNTNSPFVS